MSDDHDSVGVSGAAVRAGYFGWAMAHLSVAPALMAGLIRAYQAGELAEIPIYARSVAVLRANLASHPFNALPPEADQLEAAVADAYDQILAFAERAASGTGDVSPAGDAATAALRRAERAAVALGTRL